MRLSSVAVFLLAGAIGAANAQLYKWVDKDGNVTYSDVPPPKDAKDTKQKKFGDNVTPVDTDTSLALREAVKRNPVVLYANACGELCDNVRAFLAGRGVPYSERNPETNQAARDALKEAAGELAVPTATIGTRVVKGFVEKEWQDALSSAGYSPYNPARPKVTPPAAAPRAPSAPTAPAESAAAPPARN